MTCSSSTTSTPRRLAALALLAGLALAGPARAGGTPGAGASVKQAEAALARGDGIAAEAKLRDAIAAGVPKDRVRALLGRALLVEGNLDAARDTLTGGAFAPGTEALGWRTRGELEIAEGNLPQAGDAFDQALNLSPRDPVLWADIARLRFLGGQQAQAYDAAQRAAKLGPNDPRALDMAALMIRERYGLIPSLPWFEAGLRAAPNDTALLTDYAATLGDAGRYTAMLAVVRHLLAVDPGNARGFYLEAVLAARGGKIGLARRLMLKTGNALRDVPGAILLNGVLEFSAGNTNLAIEYFDHLARLQPDNARARELLARALARAGNWNELLRRFAPDAAQPGTSPYLAALVARALEERGERGRAVPLLERVAEARETPFAPMPAGAPLGVLAARYADDSHAAADAIALVRAAMAAGQGARALKVAIALSDANPGSSDAQALVGDARMALGDAHGAVGDYEHAYSIRRGALMLARLVGALRASGQDGEADAIAAQYLAADGRSLDAMRLLAAGYARSGRLDEADTLLDALKARGQGGALLVAQQAALAFAGGDMDAARRLAADAYDQQPASPEAARALGLVLDRQGGDKRLAEDLLRQGGASAAPRTPA